MANPKQGRKRSNSWAKSDDMQMKRSFESAEISRKTGYDCTQERIVKSDPFASSVNKNILDKQTGFGDVKPTVELHQVDRGLKTLSSDSRKAPLPEQGVKLNIHQDRMDEHITYTNKENTVT